MEETLLKRVLPNSPEAEQAVLGSMLLDREAITAAAGILHGDDFYNRQYGLIFEAMVDLNNEGAAADDPVALQDRLRAMDAPPEVSDPAFLRDLIRGVPTSANITHYAGIVYEKALSRKLIHTMESLANDCYLGHESMEDILGKTEDQVFRLLDGRKTSEFETIDETVLKVIKKIETASRNHSSVTGISTGFYDVDRMMSGLQPSDLIILAARPSMGKTAFALNLAQHIAVHSHVPTAIFSLEMSRQQLVSRLISQESQIDGQSLRTGRLEERDWDRLVESSGVVASANLIIDDTPGATVSEVRTACRKYKLEYGLQLVIIDYLQLMSGGKNVESRQQEVSKISRELKALARELNVPIIALSQLARGCELRQDHRPMLSDLRESGSIEQDADVVMFLYRDEYYNKADPDVKGKAELIIAKQRNGPTGTVDLVWRSEYAQFKSVERRP